MAKIKSKLAGWEKRYGRKGMVAILVATVVLTVVPLPGTSFIPVAVAEVILKVRG